MHCIYKNQKGIGAAGTGDDEDGDEDQSENQDHQESDKGDSRKKNPRGLDISIRFFDHYIRTMDSLKKSLDEIKERQHDQDAAVNFGVGYVEDKKLTHGISIGGINSGVYGGTDLVYNRNTKEYLLLKKTGDIMKFDWSGSKLGFFTPTKKFSRFLHVHQTGHYLCYNLSKSYFYIYREDWTLALDTVAISPIDRIVYSGRKTDENVFDFFIISGAVLNKYAYNPANNVVSLQECIKISDIESENAEIEQICFDQPIDDKTQWIYLSFKQHVSIIDVTGRVHGTKKNLHKHKITAIVAYGSSEFVVTGDEKGLLKMWGTRWTLITEIHPHSARVTHLIEHPNGRAVVSFSTDQTIFAWSLESKLKLESMKAPEIVERIAINLEKKAFMTSGPRKLVLWKMDVLFSPLSPMSAPVSNVEVTWHPNFPTRAVVYSQDNAIRVINPVTGRILKTALVNPPKPPLNSLVYIPQYETMYVLKTSTGAELNSLELQIFDTTQNPCRLKETWTESKWDTGVTAVALFDYHPSIIVAEKGIAYHTKKQVEITGAVTFIIGGLRDGYLCKIDIQTGNIDYKTPCHKGQVNQIEINPEVSQFVSLGAEPNVRLWKVALGGEELFVPLFDISWKYPIRHVALVRELIGFALSHHDSNTHKVVIFNTSETERYDHREHFAHHKEILSFSSSRELMLFCSSSLDETIRIWNEQAELVRLLVLNWIPVWAGFGTRQGDLFVGIDNWLHVVPADKYLSVIYRNRAMMDGLTAGEKEKATPLNAARSGQDPRMYIVLEEEDKYEREAKEREKEKEKKRLLPGEHAKEKRKQDETEFMEEKIPKIGMFREPKDSQRSKDYDKFRQLEEDLKQIVEGNHQFSIFVPDFRKMTKKQLDDYGKTIFPNDGDKRKMFVSESRIACNQEMQKNAKELDNYECDLF